MSVPAMIPASCNGQTARPNKGVSFVVLRAFLPALAIARRFGRPGPPLLKERDLEGVKAGTGTLT